MSQMYLSAGCIMAQLRVSLSEGSAETPKGLRVAVLSRSHFSQYDLDFEYLHFMRETRGSIDRDHTGT